MDNNNKVTLDEFIHCLSNSNSASSYPLPRRHHVVDGAHQRARPAGREGRGGEPPLPCAPEPLRSVHLPSPCRASASRQPTS